MKLDERGIEGVAPAVYFAHDAGIWRHVSDMFKPEWFRLLQKGDGAGSIQTVKEWGEWLANPDNFYNTRMQGRNVGRTVFEKLVSEGHAPNISKGALSASGIDPTADIVTKAGQRLQLKHSINGDFNPEFFAKYCPKNGVDGIGVNSESYQNLLRNAPQYGLKETSPGSGILVHVKTNTQIIDSGLNSKTSENIMVKTMEQARDHGEALDLTEHLAINAMKAAGIAAALSFAIKGSINLYKCSKGTMRGDDAIDNTVSCTIRAAVVGGITSFTVGATMVVIGIPTAGMGLVVAIPVGVAVGASVGKVVNTTFDAIYNNLMGGEFIAAARAQNAVLNTMFGNLEAHFSIAEAYQVVLDRKASELPDVPWDELESTIAMAGEQVFSTRKFLASR